MAENPDADLFEDPGKQHKHTVDGSTCPRCNRIHTQLDFENIPEEEMELLLDILDRVPDELVDAVVSQITGGNRIPPHAEFISLFFGLRGVGGFDKDNRPGPMLRALAEVVDEHTDGEVTRRYRFYEIERQIITSHQLLKTLNNALEAAKMANAKGPMWALEFTCEFMIDRLTVTTTRYRKLAAELGVEVDEQLIAAGVYAEPGVLTKYTMIDMMDLRPDSD